MAGREKGGESGRTVADRWWADLGDKRREPVKRQAGPAGTSFFRAAEGFEQDRARAQLTDNNLKLLTEADPPEGGWGYVQLAETQYPEKERERIKQMVNVPAYARAALIDSGRTVRILMTGTPIGARILELTLGEAPSFDCWIEGEWVREVVFKDINEAVKAFRGFLHEYLSPQGIAEWEQLRAHA